MTDTRPVAGGMLRRILRDPLAHFLILGALLFAAFSVLNPGWSRNDDARITVSQDTLLTFIQYRTKIFDPAMAEARLASMSPAELRKLIDDYIEEEALYREAEALGLDRDDYIIKRRMVQKVEFIASGADEPATDIDEARLERYFRDNADRFTGPALYTFTHVFIPRGQLDDKALLARAEREKHALVTGHAQFADAPKYGDRFPYGVNFAEATQEQVESQFGSPFAQALAGLTPDKNAWQGPLLSEFGAHIVMLTAKVQPKAVSLEDVRPQVEAEFARTVAEENTEKALAKIVARYPVDMDYTDPRLASPEARK